MRSIAYLILTVMLTVLLTFGILSAQEDADSAVPAGNSQGGFAPTEQVKADTAIAFPTDI